MENSLLWPSWETNHCSRKWKGYFLKRIALSETFIGWSNFFAEIKRNHVLGTLIMFQSNNNLIHDTLFIEFLSQIWLIIALYMLENVVFNLLSFFSNFQHQYRKLKLKLKRKIAFTVKRALSGLTKRVRDYSIFRVSEI